MSSEDTDWVPGPSTVKTKTTSSCLIHCTDANDNLVSLQSIESWKVLLNAARIRKHEAVLKVASSVGEGVIPGIKYHRKCRSTFTMKKLLNNIKKKENEKVCLANTFDV